MSAECETPGELPFETTACADVTEELDSRSPSPTVTTVSVPSKTANLGQKKSKPKKKSDGAHIKHADNMDELMNFMKSAGRKPVVIDLHAAWCGPCLALAPKFQELAEKYRSKIVSVKVDVDKASDVVDMYNIMALPTILVCRDQQVIYERSDSSWEHLEELFAQFAG